ncbi:cytochrome P450 4C1-like [Trichogramma pretiosum]|uniref:cytochrome P450 4C1-like n=1 Tax=Trichogramma pretiosum TaxID=7493 RepID=UPI000C718A24|nr:cytochrome P450 4C1-like [Trichogramma pretiosum]
MFYVLAFLVLVLVIFHICTRYDRRGRMLRSVPCPKPYPIFGNTLMFLDPDLCNFWRITRKVTEQFRPVSVLWMFTSAIVNIHHPDDVEILLSSNKAIEKGFVYNYLMPWLKTGLLTSTGEKWRNRRKMLTPAFHFNILKKYMEITEREGQKSIDKLKLRGNDFVVDLVELSSKYTLNIICESAMGVSLDTIDNKELDRYKQAIHEIGIVTVYRTPRPYVTNWMMPFIYKIGSLQRNALKTLHNFTAKIIQERKDYHKSTNNKYLNGLSEESEDDKLADDSIGRKKRMAMLDLLLAAQRNGLIDDQGIEEEVDTFTFEGHDTTGMAMSYTLFLLAHNQEAQERARLEVTELLEKKQGKIDMANLQELCYLERCIKESLRLYPPVSTILRHTTEDIQLKNILVPANTDIIVHFYDTHREPEYWPDPEKFDPDRFLPENSRNRHPFAYVPFSAGPRNCIGQKFAMMELKSLIARILYDFILEPIDRLEDMQLQADIVIRPNDPIRARFVPIRRE